ncbi:hypothetical protein GE21DRAFT_3477 [Neurospora crassa]|uniref:Glucan 1, 4-alpha-glucosidase n=2 Tax=Neurospora crassa TaxID=5141 RepID=F5HD64_NEUCR|nr:hypothetical protein NCU01509 [Neurospora crassa OR74A]EAA27722.2 hypothetical protein NCU01509 [Neurospora crassa OR74A]KHE78867.1 hypothetical protein GE21DRAFT_3477 [Neurospora crassa]CAB91434.2 related to glucan 1, 4-alpha-glucosidase [Neurospora crassa]|eukprot:XP_956958.2 hypothetical protein NCU01509 [Neurospora crassa OR74A]
MSTHQSQPSSPPKRPRLSLQIKTFNGSSVRTSRTLAAAVDVKSPTAFNTLSNVYATAVDRSTPIQEHAPATALSGGKPMLRLQTQEAGQNGGAAVSKDRRLQTPYLGPYLDTPLTAQPMSPAIATAQSQMIFPSAMTATPPLSAQPQEQNGPRVFTFDSSNNTNNNYSMAQPSLSINTTSTSQASEMASCSETPRRRTTFPSNVKLPYTHPRSLRSILRNSPLAPLTCQSPNSSRRQSLRLQEKAARRVAYHSPLCETITTSKYTKSHVDLLAEDSGTPTTPTGARSISSSSSSSSCSSSSEGEELLDQTMAYTGGNETRDGGQTPGPYEEMRRRMAGMHASTPISLSPTSGGIRKNRGLQGKKREKKRRWVWTIGKDAEDAELEECGSPVVPWTARPELSNAVAAAAAAAAAAERKEAMVGVPVLAVPVPPSRARTRAQTQAQSVQTVVTGNKAAAVAAAVALQIPQLPVPGPTTSSGRRLRPALSLPPSSMSTLPVPGPVVPAVSTPVAAAAAPALPLVQQQTQTQQSPPPPSPPQKHQQPEPHQQQQSSRATLTPEPTLPHIEPHTPSMESVTSMTSIMSQAESMLSEDSVFDTSSVYNGDVEMSDASSVGYDDDPAGDNESTFGGGGADGEEQHGGNNHNNSVYKKYLKVNGGGKRGGASVDQPCHSSDMDTDMDMDTPTVGGRPGYAVERLGLGIC